LFLLLFWLENVIILAKSLSI